MGESAAQIGQHDQLPADTTTSSWEALRLYAEGERAKGEDRPQEALLLFEQAIRIDPRFALAQARMGDLLMSLGRQREGFVYWQQAVSGAARQHLTTREELRIRALYGTDSGDLASAEAPLLVWSRDYPHDYLSFYYRGYVYRMQGRFDDSVAMLRTAAQLAPSSYYIPASLARTYLASGNYEAVVSAASRLRELKQADLADKFEGQARFLQGDTPRALAMLQRMTQAQDRAQRSAGLLLLARVRAELGDTAAAAQALEAGAQIDAGRNDNYGRSFKLVALGYLRRDDPPHARALALQSVALYDSPDIALHSGALLARIGYPADRERVLAGLQLSEGAPRFDSVRLRLSGEAKLALAAKFALPSSTSKKPLRSIRPWRPEIISPVLSSAPVSANARNYFTGKTLARPGMLWQNVETALPGAWLEIQQSYKQLTPGSAQ